ncbi:MAG TPA: MarR family transcriptional regulator [Thermoplasmataceae archaeon]|nr:MarR family transcriptional regulator [Thermoplasmatales archaeon AK]HLH86636.1 MarR family transcriptional regulator [Thermoplasmataceae archaeon]
MHLNPERANEVYDELRKERFSRNQAKILALLEQSGSIGIADISRILGITSSRALSALNTLMSRGYVMRMEVKQTPGRGRTSFLYRIRMPILDIIIDSRTRVEVVYSDEFMIDP